MRSLLTDDAGLANERAQALNTLMDRGDWGVIARWASGEIHISDVARSVREGDFGKLRVLNAEGVRLGEAVQRFLRRTEATRSAKTRATYESAFNLLVERFGADCVMQEIDRDTAEAFLHSPKASAKNRVWSAKSQINARTIYKALWQSEIEREREAADGTGAVPTLTRNPWRKATVPEKRSTRHSFLSPEEWSHLLETHRGTPLAAFFAVSALAGLRMAEARHLRTDIDVDLEASVLRVQSRGGEFAWATKTENSIRDVPIVPALMDLLLEHRDAGYAGARYFFRTHRKDTPLAHSTAQHWTEQGFRKAGIKYGRVGDALTHHSLRHTFASWLAADGVPFHVVAELMGNTAEIVMETYAHLAPHDRMKAMQVIQARVS